MNTFKPSPDGELSRRRFLGTAGVAVAGISAVGGSRVEGASVSSSPENATEKSNSQSLDLSSLPNFCSHEHWGSIDSIGTFPGGFRADIVQGATPTRKTGLLDILLDPYFTGFLASSGVNPNEIAKQSGSAGIYALGAQSPVRALTLLRPAIERQKFTGAYQCIRRGLLRLYGVDIATYDPKAIAELDAAIANNYSQLFSWYQRAMAEAHFTNLIRIAQPEYYVREESPQTAAQEVSFTHTLMRIDPLLELWKDDSPRRNGLAKMTGVDPSSASTWREFIAKLFDLAQAHNGIGIKQLQAYTRPLEFQPRKDSEVIFRGDLSPTQVRAFQDWVVHECCKLAHDREWVHQIHVGTNNISECNPMPLVLLAKPYTRMNIVMLHCWPFLKEAGWLAKFYPNIYIDTCWQPVLNPAFLTEALMGWLNYVPMHKITCDHDATSVEMAVGSSLFTREIMAEALINTSRHLGMDNRDLKSAALDMLHNNAVALYRIGKEVLVDDV
jgi:predicted TIM-barrel fold metal-dependent hydrolase